MGSTGSTLIPQRRTQEQPVGILQRYLHLDGELVARQGRQGHQGHQAMVTTQTASLGLPRRGLKCPDEIVTPWRIQNGMAHGDNDQYFENDSDFTNICHTIPRTQKLR